MAPRAEGLYSRVIAWLKILLPLAALALLSTIFLFSRSAQRALDMPFADALDRGETAREAVTAPYFAGTTGQGDMLTMRAVSAHPEDGDRIRAEAFEATVSLRDGSTIRLAAGEALLESGTGMAALADGVRIESSTGYVMTTEALDTAIDRVEAESRGPVEAEGPAGRLVAGGLRIGAEAEGDVQLLFTGGVKLVYEPQQD